MILDMLERIKGKLSIEFFANINEVQKLLREEMKKRGATDELKFVMEYAASNEINTKLRAICIYSLCIYYKYYRIGIFYVPSCGIEDEIKEIKLPEENEIRELLVEAGKSTDENISCWANLALEPMKQR